MGAPLAYSREKTCDYVFFTSVSLQTVYDNVHQSNRNLKFQRPELVMVQKFKLCLFYQLRNPNGILFRRLAKIKKTLPPSLQRQLAGPKAVISTVG